MKIKRRLIGFIVLLLIAITPACEVMASDWTQDKFTELITFVYNEGEKIVTGYGVEFYNVSLELPEEDDVIIRGHLGLYDFESYVVLIVEAITHDEDGNTVIDHNFYSSYFIPDLGEYCCLPNEITGNIIVKDKDSVIESVVPKLTQRFELEGYENEEWLFWMGLFYEYMQTEKAKGRSI
jgi:hypothetical protein